MAGTKATSARGVPVDFDLMKIKEQLSVTPKPIEITDREEMIKTKRKRKKVKADPVVLDDAEIKDDN